MKYTLIINHNSMANTGGIEQYVFCLARYMINNGHRVIWLCDSYPRSAKSFQDVMLCDKVERYDVKTHGLNWFVVPKIEFDSDEMILIMSFNPIEMAQAEMFCINYEQYDVHPIYYVPDTTGNQYYLERNFFGFLRKSVQGRMKKIHSRWELNDAISFFSITQVMPLEKNYGITIKNYQEKVLKEVRENSVIDLELIKRKAETRDKFVIITVGRFDFPHKGYMLGLIKAFARLKSAYPGLELRIVGYGKDESILLREINSINEDYRKDIHIIGEVPQDELPGYMKEAHLNISVAGAVGDGARSGVLSIPARNYYSDECEVYGYLPESRLMATSLEKGLLVDQFIEEAQQMSNEDYINKCIDSFNTYVTEVEPMFVFNSIDGIAPLKPDIREIKYIKKLTYAKKFIDKAQSLVERKKR